jgi:hypothetical protein
MGRIVTQDKLNELTGQSIDYGKGGGYCPYYDLLISRWGNVVKQPNNYRSDQLVKEEDIVVNTDLFLINTEAGSLYFAGGGTYAQIPAIDGHEDFIYIAGGGEAIGALSALGGLYVVNQSTKQWELKYKDTARTYGYAHLARFSTGWVFHKGAAGGDGKNYVIIVYDNGTTKELSVVGNVYSISTGPYNYCCVGVHKVGARIYTFIATSAPDSLTYYTPGMFTPNAVIQGAYASPRGIVYSTTSNYTYFSANPTGTQWTAATTRPQLTALTKGLYANAEFMLIGGNMKSVSTDGGQNWTTSTLGAYTLTDLIYVDSNWYAIGSNGTKRLLLQNTASTFDQSNKILDLPDYSRQVIKINV